MIYDTYIRVYTNTVMPDYILICVRPYDMCDFTNLKSKNCFFVICCLITTIFRKKYGSHDRIIIILYIIVIDMNVIYVINTLLFTQPQKLSVFK